MSGAGPDDPRHADTAYGGPAYANTTYGDGAYGEAGYGDGAYADQPDAEALVRRVIEMLDNSKSVPLSTSVLVNKDEVIELLEAALARMPAEVRQARWMLRERDEHLTRVRREAQDIVESARVRAERLVQRTEIVREAQRAAQRHVDEARETANRLRLEAEDYCDQKLAAFELALLRVQRSVAAGRAKLRGPLEQAMADAERAQTGDDPDRSGGPPGPFDQDSV